MKFENGDKVTRKEGAGYFGGLNPGDIGIVTRAEDQHAHNVYVKPEGTLTDAGHDPINLIKVDPPEFQYGDMVYPLLGDDTSVMYITTTSEGHIITLAESDKKEAEDFDRLLVWKFTKCLTKAKTYPTITREDIAEKFNIPLDKLKIKEAL